MRGLLLAVALGCVTAPAAAQPRLVAVEEEGWDASAEWQGVGGTPISTEWSAPFDCLRYAGSSDYVYCITCADECAGAEVPITGRVTALGPAEWTSVTDTVTLRCAGPPDPEPEDPERDPDPEPEDPERDPDPEPEDPERDPEPVDPEPVSTLPLWGAAMIAAAFVAAGRRAPSSGPPPE